MSYNVSLNLTGVWEGQFTFPRRFPATAFVATLIETGSVISGMVHEPDVLGHNGGETLFAMVEGRRDGARVSFVKTYERRTRSRSTVVYEGRLSADGTEIEGRWTISGVVVGAVPDGAVGAGGGGGREEGAGGGVRRLLLLLLVLLPASS